MTRHVRFSVDPNVAPTVADTHPAVRYGLLEEDGLVYVTQPFSRDKTGECYPLDQVRLLPPCYPTKILCVGRNYAEHARELGNEPPAEPIIFMKPNSSLLAHGGEIVYPKLSRHLSYEGELGVVIGKRARRVPADRADEVIFGYTCVNDVTARDLQQKDEQWTRCKGFDTFCPVGPWIVPREEVQLDALRVCTWVDGEKKQDAPVTDMLFSVGQLIEFLSAFLTLEPGDLIATGTPPGVGRLEIGSRVRVEINGVGCLENIVVAEQD